MQCHFQERDPGRRWVKDAAVAVNSDGPLDARCCLTPNVVKMDGGYRLYYMGCGPERPRQASAGYILSAFSEDAATWRKEPGIRLDAGGEGAEFCIWGPDVTPLAGGGYRMYFEGRCEIAAGIRSVIVSARSADGLQWEQEPGIRLGGGGDVSYGAPRCLSLGGGESGFRLYASASPFGHEPEPVPPAYTGRHIVSARSGDGLDFVLEEGVRVAQDREHESYALYAPEVLRLGSGGYRMYYAAWTPAPEVPAGSPYHGRVLSAVSDDGLQWRKDPGVCLDNGGRWDRAKASEPCVIDLPDGRFRMFYEACDYTGRWRIASATST